MTYAVFASLSRRLTEEERTTLFEALDAAVPGSGYVGLDKGPHDEVYFCVEALSEEEARAQAARYMGVILEQARLDVENQLFLMRHTWSEKK